MEIKVGKMEFGLMFLYMVSLMNMFNLFNKIYTCEQNCLFYHLLINNEDTLAVSNRSKTMS